MTDQLPLFEELPADRARAERARVVRDELAERARVVRERLAWWDERHPALDNDTTEEEL